MNNMKQKILSLLVLLITAVGGAWAQEVDPDYYDIYINFGSSYDRHGTFFQCMIMSMESDAINGTLNLSVDGESKGSFNVNDNKVEDFIDALDAGDHTWSAEFKPEGGGSIKKNGNFTIDKLYTSIAYYGSTSINMGVGESTELDVYVAPDGADGLSYSSSDASVASITQKDSYTYIIQAKAAGTATITFSFAGNKNYEAAEEDITITVTVLTPPIKVTTNAAEEGGTFTEASFEMQTSDVDVNYELVRDMSYKVAFSGVPTRARLAKDGDGKFHFADGLTFQLLDNIDATNPKDITSAEGITFMVGEVEAVDFEGHTFYQLNKETLVPLADFLADAHLGNYAICAVASTGEYDGSFASGMITLFQGYEVEVAAKEFITYYKDEPLRVEDEAAELYTISSVNDTQAVLSQKSDAMPSNTPMLVYNNSDETKVILLIPCNEPDLAITVAPEFKGTLTGTTIAASTDAQTNYALNGKQFVFVKNDISIAANKAWLSFETFNNAKQRSISIVFEEGTTELDEIKNDKPTDDTWYDLNGRKLDGEPTTKGVFIKNGKKVMR